MIFLYGVGIYNTLASFWFLLSAFSTDVLFIRIYLLSAYVCLLIGGILNFPPWPELGRVNGNIILLGAIIWPAVTGLLHLYSLVSLMWDERPICFASEDEEQMWRLFYRRSGMGRLEFKNALKLGKWKRYSAGQVVFDSEDPKTCHKAHWLHFMMEGKAVLSAKRKDAPAAQANLVSGYLFDLAVLNAFGVYIGLQGAPLEKVTAVTDILLFEWDTKAVERMAGNTYPALAAAWRSLTLYAIGSAFSSTCGENYASDGEKEDIDVFLMGARSRDLVEPLKEEEIPRDFSIWPPHITLSLIWEFMKWLVRTHNPLPPTGIRHNSMPTSGMLARGRLLASTPSPNFLRSRASRQLKTPDAEFDKSELV